jgi:hypothetical protein
MTIFFFSVDVAEVDIMDRLVRARPKALRSATLNQTTTRWRKGADGEEIKKPSADGRTGKEEKILRCHIFVHVMQH